MRGRTLTLLASAVATIAFTGCSLTATAAFVHKPETAVTPADQAAAWTAWVAVLTARENAPELVCIRSHESAGLPNPWAAYNPDGPYYGAYQYLASTWANIARAEGRPDLAGSVPQEPYVSRWDQDEVTLAYLRSTGDWSPWGGPCS